MSTTSSSFDLSRDISPSKHFHHFLIWSCKWPFLQSLPSFLLSLWKNFRRLSALSRPSSWSQSYKRNLVLKKLNSCTYFHIKQSRKIKIDVTLPQKLRIVFNIKILKDCLLLLLSNGGVFWIGLMDSLNTERFNKVKIDRSACNFVLSFCFCNKRQIVKLNPRLNYNLWMCLMWSTWRCTGWCLMSSWLML